MKEPAWGVDNENCQPGMNQAIAEHVNDCWEQFAAGTLKVFNTYDVDTQCIICSVIEFDDDVKNKFGYDVYASDILPEEKNLDEYMRTTPLPGRQISYYQYTTDALDHFDGGDYYDYNFGKSYAIVFAAVNEHQILRHFENAMDFVRDKILHWETDEDEYDFINRLHYVEQDLVIERCDYLANQ